MTDNPKLDKTQSEDTDLDAQRRLFELLQKASDLDGEVREELLAAADPELARGVREMLDDDRDEGFLRTGDFEHQVAAQLEPAALLAADQEIGPYRIVRLLGTGGMGQVYLARQDAPVQRQVAIKVLRSGVLAPQLRQRFELERQAMERLDHPNVGKILDAGSTNGHPYLVMEYIDGDAITEYCDAHRLDLDARLHLLVDVCRGVAHAHRRFFLHRDIKPTNVLVTEVDGRPVPKLIDFGIAKVLDPAVTSGLTGHQAIGTPSYMSPEALTLQRDLDIRSDVFSLGVLLYQLLTGRLPWGDDISLASLLERRAQGNVRRPSTLFSRPPTVSQPATREAAERRQESVGDLSRRLRADLDWIVLRAIASEPEERYGTVDELAADLERTLNHQPIEARPPNLGYVLRKAYQRQRGTVLAAAAAVLLLVLGSIGTTVGLLRARTAESQARAEAEAARQAEAESQQVVSWLVGAFGASGVESRDTTRSPTEVTALELIDASAARLDEDLQAQPAVRARLAMVIGGVYRQLGRFDDAKTYMESALELYEELPETDPFVLSEAHRSVAEVYLQLEDLQAMRQSIEQGLELLGGLQTRPAQKGRADLHSVFGMLHLRTGEYDAAALELQKAIAIHTRLEGPDSLEVGIATANLGNAAFRQEDWPRAEATYRRALEIFDQTLPPGHDRTLVVTNGIAGAVASQGRLDEAAPLFESVYEEQRKLLGDDHVLLANSLNNLGMLHLDLGQPHKAATYHRRALNIRLAALGPNNTRTAWSFDNLARTLGRLGQLDEAWSLQSQALAVREAHYGPDHRRVARSCTNLSDLALQRGDFKTALDFLERANAINRQTLAEDHSQHARNTVRLAAIQWHLGHPEEASKLAEEGLRFLAEGGDELAEDLADAHQHLVEHGAADLMPDDLRSPPGI